MYALAIIEFGYKCITHPEHPVGHPGMSCTRKEAESAHDQIQSRHFEEATVTQSTAVRGVEGRRWEEGNQSRGNVCE